MAKLTYEERERLRKTSFAIPEERKYPIHDRVHAAAALQRASQHGTPEERRKVIRAVCRLYPDMPTCEKRKGG